MSLISDRNQALGDWYATTRRRLPWRETSDPWEILVSEVMLQQTQVSRVLAVYPSFLARFPTPERLAMVSLAEVIAAWGDLGYQRRAVNLWRTARILAEDGWPESPEGLQRLPGVGRYTAAAAACFAFGHPVPAVDTNLQRVLSRWVGRQLAGRELDEVAAELIDEGRASDWNQAVMDLGATLCRPRRPACPQCPVSRWCLDPSLTVVRPRQPGYEGSVRQARARILRHVAREGPSSRTGLAEALQLRAETITLALDRLESEGLVDSADGVVRIRGA